MKIIKIPITEQNRLQSKTEKSIGLETKIRRLGRS